MQVAAAAQSCELGALAVEGDAGGAVELGQAVPSNAVAGEPDAQVFVGVGVRRRPASKGDAGRQRVVCSCDSVLPGWDIEPTDEQKQTRRQYNTVAAQSA